MAKVKGDIIVELEKCKGCELCAEACPQDALALSNEINTRGYRYIVRIEDSCTGCENCALVCPEGIIRVYRKKNGKKEEVAKITNVKGDIKLTVNK